MTLIIGNKTYSSWSLRPWVLMRHFDIPFQEVLIKLDLPTTRQEILKFSPSAKVPSLTDGSICVWESMSICEYLNEKYPEKKMWPQDVAARARARSISNEMHAGFTTLRNHMSHHLKKEFKGFDWSPAKADIERIKQIWNECLAASRGPFLFGGFSIADAMYAPVVNRFITYGVPIESSLAGYVKAIRELPAHKDWIEGALQEDFIAPLHETN